MITGHQSMREHFVEIWTQGNAEIQIPLSRNPEDVDHSGIVAELDKVTAMQQTTSCGHLTESSLLVETCIHCRYSRWHESSAVQPCTFSTDHVVSVEVRKATDLKNSPCSGAAREISSRRCALAARPNLKSDLQPG